MLEPKIVVPSRGRAGMVTTHNHVADVILCVAESQFDLYKDHYPNVEVVSHPDEIESVNFANKLQWILDKFKSVFYLDDDVVSMNRVYVDVEPDYVPADVAREIILNSADIAHQMGAYMYSFNTSGDPRNYTGIKPFRLTGFAAACGLGILADSKLYWNSNIHTHHDYWMSLLNAYHHQYCFIDERFTFKCKPNFTTIGGGASFRTVDLEGDAVAKLREWFGSQVVLKKRATTRAKAVHEHQITLNLPF